MAVTTPEYRTCFRPGDQVTIGLQLADSAFAEDSAVVKTLEGREMRLELCGRGFPSHLIISRGTRVVITRREGRNVFTCSGQIETTSDAGEILLKLGPMVEIDERREYAREDVAIKLEYSLPPSQEMTRIIREWEELKKCRGDCLTLDASPCRDNCNGREMQRKITRINLSGSGLRFKISDCLSYGTLLHLKVAIPDASQDHIHAIGSIVRTRELFPFMEQNDYYSTTMAFKVIDSHDRKKLLEYVLREQHRALR